MFRCLSWWDAATRVQSVMAQSTLEPELQAAGAPGLFERQDLQRAALFVGELVAHHGCSARLGVRLAHHHLRAGRRLAAALLLGKVALQAASDGDDAAARSFAHQAIDVGGWRSAAGWLPAWAKAAGPSGIAFLCDRALAKSAGDPRQAVELLEIAYRLDPGSVTACRGLLALDRRLGSPTPLGRLPPRFDAGLKALVAAGRCEALTTVAAVLLAEFPGDPTLLRTLVGMYLASGERRRAIEILQRLLNLLPDDAAARNQLARALKAA